jgi:type I restriction enzyme S subunit
MVAIRPNAAMVYPRYLFALLRSNEVQRRISNMHVGTLIPHFKKGDFDKLLLPIPPRSEQVAIGDLYFDISARIDLLARTNATLESIAQALFKSWFIDFDPVRAKVEGREPEGMGAATAALFPAEFEESALGLLPKGWRAAQVGDVFRVTMGQSPPGETYNQDGSGMPFYQGRADFGFRFPSIRIRCTAPTRYAEAGDVLVSVRAPVGDVNVALEPCSIGRGLAAVALDTAPSFALYSMKALRERFDEYESHGTVFGSINKKQFEALPCVLPSPQMLSTFSSWVEPLDDRLRVNELQSRSLVQLRDTLLPRLISGKLSLPEAEAVLEAA